MATRFATTGPEGPQLGPDDAANLRTQFNALRTQVAALHTSLDTALAQLDADAGVTDTDYVANCAPAADTSAALTDA